MNKDIVYMNRAWELALQGWGRTSPNPMVGAVIVKKAKIIAEGYHHYCGGDHAEVDALKKAGSGARGGTLYVTMEPCGHWGRTPPCTEAILKAGIKKVVAGALDANKLNGGKSLKLLRRRGVEVEQGLLAEELARMNEAFNCWIIRRRPLVTAKIAQTLDGKIATLQGQSQWITSAFARDYAHRYRFGFDAILAGINTVLKDDPRLNTLPAKNIKKIILDTHGKMSRRAKLLEGARPEDVFVFTGGAQIKKIKAQVIRAPLYKGKIDLKWVLKFLGDRQVTSVLIEGGGKVVGEALQRGLVDKLMIYAAPKIMGEGLAGIRGLKPAALSKMVGLRDMSVDKIGEDILIQGYPYV
ncbi:MAG: bifunctional diaminohydroxyphosphoribosylaminopyrimidine deaminase/5-amino-6-(5-phosphoribosylamino)uracil reductase RibD [Candidatus Omnitrophica bacterium]|nr:bifunctional diaminohydroxyphosphoribosylaminopyrimidine deaminase/5-amino-6-(5-phosphoribosylamino)uracil reductase RibD [Candidatus Omnitrophota bacterium]MDE2009797.1 bifunctional diaminohydroxyphosphoribosylaminopyrimidine deaminase/5-amino-6-(5-phosphoribosylamino)uracil reductase RibD [Candidatus Omnitrophota bacterium]MDE2215142.1 bifunctional diaminohydroxyphosphoribosylaminopyrimidine deaminase/5-amino-6-(5-phosphoribosylamino)uracil reductase RibD [Candidatus Omnitrophota bacterium]